MIELQAARYVFGNFSLAADFQLEAESFTAVIGPSGAGKSTLLSLIAGYEKLSEGRTLLQGLDVTEQGPGTRPVSMIFQDNNDFPHLTAFENVALGIQPNLHLTSTQNDAVQKALEQCGLVSLAQRKPGEMSGGERQRIAIARALVREKPILLLDEPFAALGPALRREMHRLLRALQTERRLTIMLVTHNPEDAKSADQVMFVGQGRVHPAVPSETFFERIADPDIRSYLG